MHISFSPCEAVKEQIYHDSQNGRSWSPFCNSGKQQLNAVAGEHEGTPSQVHLAGFDVGYDDEEQEVAIMTEVGEFNATLIQCFGYSKFQYRC